MAIPTGAAAYKKKDGVLTLTPDQKTVIWTPKSAPAGPPTISLEVPNITNLQQTPDHAAKVMLKIFEKTPGAADPVAHLFHFNSPSDPRAEANVIRDLLSQLIAKAKNNDPGVPRPNGAAPSASAPGGNASSKTASASTTATKKVAPANLFDDDLLKKDMVLQQSLLMSDSNLYKIYADALKTKPETLRDVDFNSHFWSTRINLLRAHAIETNQKKGPYNVLAQIKPTLVQGTQPDEESKLVMNFSVEQIQMILNQHPLVKRIYNEHVPPLTSKEFWERFFLSKLSKKLRGERTTGLEAPDKIFDKYDEYDDIAAFSSKLLAQQVPHIIDLEGNEENQGGFRGGNRKDVEMRPRGRKDVPIIQTLNSISEKILKNSLPAETDPENPTGSDDETYQELALRDLRGDVEESRIILNIKEQSRFFGSDTTTISDTTATYAKQKPSQVLKSVQGDLGRLGEDGAGGVNVHLSLGIDDDSESDDEGEKKPHVGSRKSRKDAATQIIKSMEQRRGQLFGLSSDEATPMGLSAEIMAQCNLTHATTLEFINQFWSAFLSGDPARADELLWLSEALKRSKDRIEAVALEAEKARQEKYQQEKTKIVQYYDRTGKRKKMPEVPGGRKAVAKLMDPVIRTIDKAIADYQKALAAEGIQVSTER
ncbi:TFIIH p62 subunit domain-containing protein [Xylariaceae sp. FL0016]|nr:TFIIH p62 subunit domain-containing protein [Xylariaceae sp. FL0016]